MLRGEAVFPGFGHTPRVAPAAFRALLSSLLVSHPQDPQAILLRLRFVRVDTAECGAWAGKIGSHEAHHRFGTLGRLPHVQVNLWRVGVKGSGVSYRLPLVSPLRALSAVSQMLL